MTAPRYRARPGCTHEPWPCCGTEADMFGRPRGTICGACRHLIAEGVAARERAAAEGLAVYRWTERSWSWPRFLGLGGLSTERHDQLSEAFHQLAARLTRPAPADTPRDSPAMGPAYRDHRGETRQDPVPWPRLVEPPPGTPEYRQGSWDWGCLVLAEPATREALQALYAAIGGALRDAHAGGLDRGRSALLQLAAGELSLSDFQRGGQ